jgi:hypothetical protein
VQLWLADTITADIFGRFARSDSIVVITTGVGSAVLAPEIDEGTELGEQSAPTSPPTDARWLSDQPGTWSLSLRDGSASN